MVDLTGVEPVFLININQSFTSFPSLSAMTFGEGPRQSWFSVISPSLQRTVSWNDQQMFDKRSVLSALNGVRYSLLGCNCHSRAESLGDFEYDVVDKTVDLGVYWFCDWIRQEVATCACRLTD